MLKQTNKISKRRKIESAIILAFCAFVICCMTYVLLFSYKPNQNAFGALASVCMDVICVIILIVFVVNIVFEENSLSRTTKLFLCLLLGSIYALFFDFLTWSSDGSLAYGEKTYIYTILSLCCGSILAGVFGFYLSSYFDDMYGLKSIYIRAKICMVFNLIAFVITVVLAISGTAFIFEDGHYRTGILYDGVTAIPVLTLIYMTFFAVINFRIIGKHDVIAAVGYIFIMIAGALIESVKNIGTSYVALAVADIFIFVMLQNKLIASVTRQKDILADEISSQYEILKSMAGIYSYVNYVDFEEKIVRRFDEKDAESEILNVEEDAHSTLNKILYEGMEDELKEKFWAYTDLSTLNSRMAKDKIISEDFCHKKDGWIRAQYIRIGECSNEPISRVIFAVRNIDEEKKNVEKWIRRSNTDELTGFLNRRAYEDDIKKNPIKDNFVYVSMDVNSLKAVNDSRGHDAGDELLVGASECMKQCFEAYGKLYRIGGDEFVALIYADTNQLNSIKQDFDSVTKKWTGEKVEHLAVSCGYVCVKDVEDKSIHNLSVLADRKMYEEKSKYYQSHGIDRRGQY